MKTYVPIWCICLAMGCSSNDQKASQASGGMPVTAGAGGSAAGGTAGAAGSTSGGGNAGGAIPVGGMPAAGAGGSATMGGAAGSAGTGGGDVASGPSPASIIIQDNFDATTGKPDPAKWEPYPQGQEALGPVVDTARKHSGSNAALVTSTNSGIGSFLVPVSGKLPAMGNAFYVRVFINWEKATSAISGHSGFIVGSAARQNDGTELRLGISSKGPNATPRMDLNLQNPTDGGGETTRYSNGYTDGGNPADFPATGFQFAADTWYCLEAFFNGASGASEFRVWVDSNELAEMHVTDFRGNMSGAPRTAWAPSYSYLKIGAQDYDANLGRIWYDDVVVATEAIGCEYVVP